MLNGLRIIGTVHVASEVVSRIKCKKEIYIYIYVFRCSRCISELVTGNTLVN